MPSKKKKNAVYGIGNKAKSRFKDSFLDFRKIEKILEVSLSVRHTVEIQNSEIAGDFTGNDNGIFNGSGLNRQRQKINWNKKFTTNFLNSKYNCNLSKPS